MDERVQTCRCGKTFVQRRHHETGKLNPITAYEVENGNVSVNDDGSYRIIKKGEVYDGPRYISHFADCPESKGFRRS